MSEELLTTALCWELRGKVSVQFAYAQNGRPITLHCPDATCLVEVCAMKKKNFYFQAPGRHTPKCRWEKESTAGAPVPGVSRPKLSPLAPTPAPTYLGTGPVIRRGTKPSHDELLQLALRVEHGPIIHLGTLGEVVDAWRDMPEAVRTTYPLSITGSDLTYATAFDFLGNAGLDISALDSENRIIFGKATVGAGGKYFFVTMIKRFDSPNGRLPITMWVPKSASSANGLDELVGVTSTAFWHGPIPALSEKGKSFVAIAPAETTHSGLIVKAGEHKP